MDTQEQNAPAAAVAAPDVAVSESVPESTTAANTTPTATDSTSAVASKEDKYMTAAQLMEKHAVPHPATVEEVVDEADANSAAATEKPASTAAKDAPSTAAAATIKGPAAAKKPAKAPLDISSTEAFPTLGGPAPIKPIATPVWSHRPTTVPPLTNGGYAQNSAAAANGDVPVGSGSTNTLELRPMELIPRRELKKAPADIAKEVGKRTSTNIQMSTTATGVMVAIIKGPPNNISNARRELCRELCLKKVLHVTVPTFVRPHIIGRGGEIIKRLQMDSGTKITVPKQTEGEQQVFEDDGTTVTIVIEGDSEGTQLAKSRIDKIVKEKTSQVTLRVTDFDPKYYPFIAGPHFKTIDALQKGKDLQITVPEEPFTKDPATPAGPIVLKGDKVFVNEAKTAIAKIVQDLESSVFTSVAVDLKPYCQKYIYGKRGEGLHEILAETGCHVSLLPAGSNTGKCEVSGPSDKIGAGISKVLAIQSNYQYHAVAINGAHRSSPLGQDVHARAIARYFKNAQALRPIENATQAEFTHPEIPAKDATLTYEIVAGTQTELAAARAQFRALVESITPAKIRRMELDPLSHHTIIGKDQKGLKHVYEKYGVHLVIGEDAIFGNEVFLIYEGKTGEQVTPEEIQAKLDELEESLQGQASAIGSIDEDSIFIPIKFLTAIQDGTTFNALSTGNVEIKFSKVSSKGEEPEKINVRVRGASTGTGASSDVKNTIKRINTWVENNKDVEDPAKQFVQAFEYPAQFSAMLIGSKGSNVNKLRDDLGVDIRLKEGKGEIKGVQVNVEVAKRRLLEQIKQLEDNTVIKVKAPQEYHRTIIGTGGRFVRRLEEKYGVRINFPKSKDDDAKSDTGSEEVDTTQKPTTLAADEIVIKGGKKGVADAKSEIEELLKYEIANSQSATLSIAVKHLKPFYGIYGKDVRRIREEGGVRVDVANDQGLPPDAKVDIKIKGTREAVAAAKKELSKIIADVEQLTVRKIDVDKKYHRALIGTGGATLREIVEKAGGPTDRHAQARMVHFPTIESTDNFITLEGNAAVVEKIAEAINKIVSEKQSQVQTVVEVSPDKHWKLIGRGGSVRQELEARFKVGIDVPRQNTQGPSASNVTITGLPADVEAAKAHIISLTREVAGETVNVPEYLHHAVADGGLFIKKLRNELRVNVDHNGLPHPQKPTPARRPDTLDTDSTTGIAWAIVDSAPPASSATAEFPWILRGPNPEAILKARELLEKQVALVKEQTVTGYMVLPDPSKHRLVVGQAGVRVNKIREETGCRIMIPKDRADGDAIVMHGSKEGLEKARSIIVDIVTTDAASGAERAERGERRNGGKRE